MDNHESTISTINICEEMAKCADGKTFVPQILVDDSYFGGLTELKSYYETPFQEN
ncbi:MAG: hypothetical protein H8E85_04110 [Candidatus Marinimicrobia bacterium]|nr:hypothetical protein [Candidatus Neomarinimicrobiota bacterium]